MSEESKKISCYFPSHQNYKNAIENYELDSQEMKIIEELTGPARELELLPF